MADETNLPAIPQEKNLKVTDLLKDPLEIWKADQFKFILNQKPQKKWIKDNPNTTQKKTLPDGTIKEVPGEYIGIGTHEFLLDYIFKEWRVEIKSITTIFHSVAVEIRLHYKNPTTGEWSFHDGIGASKCQSDKGQPFSADTIKASAVQMALPAAKSYAIKDAAEHLGEIFGRNLNRADAPVYKVTVPNQTPEQPDSDVKATQRLHKLISAAKSRKDLQGLAKDLKTQEDRDYYDSVWKLLPA